MWCILLLSPVYFTFSETEITEPLLKTIKHPLKSMIHIRPRVGNRKLKTEPLERMLGASETEITEPLLNTIK